MDKKEKKRSVALYLDDEVVFLLDKIAADEDRSRSEIANRILMGGLK